MNRSIIRALCALALAGALALSLAGCESIKNGGGQCPGLFQQRPAGRRTPPTGPRPLPTPSCCPKGPTPPPSGPDVVSNGTLYGVYNGIWTRNTGYFQVSGDSLTITACGTAEGTQRYKIRPVEKGGRRGPSTSTAPPAISPPTAPTTNSPSAGWTRRPSTPDRLLRFQPLLPVRDVCGPGGWQDEDTDPQYPAAGALRPDLGAWPSWPRAPGRRWPPLPFLACRSWLAVAALWPVCHLFDAMRRAATASPVRPAPKPGSPLSADPAGACAAPFCSPRRRPSRPASPSTPPPPRPVSSPPCMWCWCRWRGLSCGRAQPGADLGLCGGVRWRGLYLLCMQDGFGSIRPSDGVLLAVARCCSPSRSWRWTTLPPGPTGCG